MRKEDLLAAGWEPIFLGVGPRRQVWWQSPDVRDSHPHTFEQAQQAEEIRRKRDGGG